MLSSAGLLLMVVVDADGSILLFRFDSALLDLILYDSNYAIAIHDIVKMLAALPHLLRVSLIDFASADGVLAGGVVESRDGSSCPVSSSACPSLMCTADVLQIITVPRRSLSLFASFVRVASCSISA